MRDRLPDLLHERLDPSARAAVLAHVGQCPDCRAELALLRQMRVSFSSGIIAVDTRAITRSVVERTITTGAATPRPVQVDGHWRDWRLAAAIVVIVVGGASVAMLRATRSPNEPSTASPTVAAVPPRIDTTPAAPRTPRDLPPVSRVAGTETASQSRAELAAAGDVNELSESELRTLLGDLDTIEAVPPTEPDPVTVQVSLPGSGGTD
jgi:anti-sigma factor RsiW